MLRVGDGPPEPQRLAAPTPPPQADRAAFVKQFQTAQSQASDQSLQQLLERVDQHAERLLKKPTPGEVAAYRESIRRFMKEVSDKLGRVDKRTDRRNRTLLILRELDSKLAALTEDVLGSQAKAIDLAATLNEIRGLLLDLLI